jgi:hypothetical protein
MESLEDIQQKEFEHLTAELDTLRQLAKALKVSVAELVE